MYGNCGKEYYFINWAFLAFVGDVDKPVVTRGRRPKNCNRMSASESEGEGPVDQDNVLGQGVKQHKKGVILGPIMPVIREESSATWQTDNKENRGIGPCTLQQYFTNLGEDHRHRAEVCTVFKEAAEECKDNFAQSQLIVSFESLLQARFCLDCHMRSSEVLLEMLDTGCKIMLGNPTVSPSKMKIQQAEDAERGLRKVNQELQKSLSTVRGQKTILQDEIDTLRIQLEELNNGIDTVRNELVTTNGENLDLLAKNKKLDNVGPLKKKVDELKMNIEIQQKRNFKAAESASTAREELSRKKKALLDLECQNSSLEQKLRETTCRKLFWLEAFARKATQQELHESREAITDEMHQSFENE